MLNSVKPIVVGNIQPLLETFTENMSYYLEVKNAVKDGSEPQWQLELAKISVSNARKNCEDVSKVLLLGRRCSLHIQIVRAGESAVFGYWHTDRNLAIASSILITEFLEGPYEPADPGETIHSFDNRIALAVEQCTLGPVGGLQHGDIVVSGDINTESALHRATTNTSESLVMRAVLTGR